MACMEGSDTQPFNNLEGPDPKARGFVDLHDKVEARNYFAWLGSFIF